MPCRPILDLIESTRWGKALLLSRRTSLESALGGERSRCAFLRSDEDMTARKVQKVVAVATSCKAEGNHPLSVGHGLGRGAEAEGRSEGTNDVQVIDRLEKLRTSFAHVEGLAVVDVNVGDLVVPEKG